MAGKFGLLGPSSPEIRALQDSISRLSREPTEVVQYPLGKPSSVVKKDKSGNYHVAYGDLVRCDVTSNNVYLFAPKINPTDIGKTITISNVTTASGYRIYVVPAGKQTIEGMAVPYQVPCEGYNTAILSAISTDNWIDANTTTSGTYDLLQHSIHDNINNEIYSVTEKLTTTSGDVFLIEDSEDSYSKKFVQIGNLDLGGAGTVDRFLLFSDDTEFSETGTSYVTKKQFRVTPDADKLPTTWRFILSAWMVDCVDGESGAIEVDVGTDTAAETGITSATETIIPIDVVNTSVGDSILTVSIKVKVVGTCEIHLKYSDMYCVFEG